MKRKLFFYSIFFLGLGLEAQSFEKFSFPVLAHGIYGPLGSFFVGANKEVPHNDFAVSVAFRNGSRFSGLTPSHVILDGVQNEPNPLHGAAIEHLALLGNRPVVIKKETPLSLFLLDANSLPVSVFQSPILRDAQRNVASRARVLTTSAAQLVRGLDVGASLAAFVAVPNNEGTFDGNGSGIAVVFFRYVFDEIENKKFLAWDPIDAQTGASSYNDQSEYLLTRGNKAKPLGKDTPAIMINEPVAALKDVVDMHFDRDLGKLYIALDVKASKKNNAGARALIVASIANGRLLYQSIAPDSAFGSNDIVGSRDSGSRISLSKVRTMQTRTHLRYLIVVRGLRSGQSVFALPLVDNLNSPAHGTLANVLAKPVTLFGTVPPHFFRSRVFAQPATRPDELFTMSSEAARVGGNGLLPGPISDISIAGEAVFVSCDRTTQSSGSIEGIFHSQPVFDSEGRIAGWTDWQRVAGAVGPVAGHSYDQLTGTFWYLPRTTLTTGIMNVSRNQWTDGSDKLGTLISTEFPRHLGGVQGLFDFPVTTPSFSKRDSERLAIHVYTGYRKVVIVQTGKEVDKLFTPWTDLEDIFRTEDGTLASFQGASVLSCTGGVLNDLGPLTSATIVTDDNNGWFVVGGTGGIAILADSQGRGWSSKQGLGSRFTGLTPDHAWRIIRTTGNVLKLLSEGSHLFVLTTDSVERLRLSAAGVQQGDVSGIVIAQLTDAQKAQANSYSDLYTKGPLGILATSFGLYRTGSCIDIRKTNYLDESGWTFVPVAESVGS